MSCKEGQFDVVEQMVNNQFKPFSINSNAQDVNEMTQFELNVRLLDPVEYSLWTWLDFEMSNCSIDH